MERRAILPKPIQTAEVLEEFLAKIHGDVGRTSRRIVQLTTGDGQKTHLSELLADPAIEIESVTTGAALLEAIRRAPADAVILTPEVSDLTLATLAERITSEPKMGGWPIVLQLPAEAEPEQTMRWQRLAHEFNLEACDSPARLIQQVVRSLNIPVSKLAEPAQKMLHEGHKPASILAGKKVLIVDDDIRNIFALTSILERYDMVTVSAETGRDAINLLQAVEDVDIVLMDIMMPEMDGLDTTRAIRQISKFRDLPIVAVTAKAMKGDREKCIEAGAWDYLSKPVDPEQMLGVLRAWLTVG